MFHQKQSGSFNEFKQADEVLRFEREMEEVVGAETAEKVKKIISDLVSRYTASPVFSYNHRVRDEWITRRVAELRCEAEKKGSPRSYADIYEQVAGEVGRRFGKVVGVDTVKHIFRGTGRYGR